jgi:hypothetical protein
VSGKRPLCPRSQTFRTAHSPGIARSLTVFPALWPRSPRVQGQYHPVSKRGLSDYPDSAGRICPTASIYIVAVIFFVCLLIVVCRVTIMRLVRATDRTPILVAGERIAHTAGIACCSVVGHIRKPRTRRGCELHKNLFLAIYAFNSRKNTKTKESAADRLISNRLVKLKVF